MTKNSQNPPATQDQELTSTDQAALTNPTSRMSLETSRVSLETNRVSLETNREELAADGGSKQQEETLPQFPAGVGRPKRYSTRRQKTEDAGTQMLKVMVVANIGGWVGRFEAIQFFDLSNLK